MKIYGLKEVIPILKLSWRSYLFNAEFNTPMKILRDLVINIYLLI